MKLLSNKTFLILLVLLSGYGYIISCTHDDELTVPIQITKPFVPTRGTATLLPGNLTAGNANEWKLDKVHSSVLWSTTYLGAAGLLTGRFNQFGMHDVTDAEMVTYSYTDATRPPQPLRDTSWAFYENEPSKTYFNGYVQINTSNTGEPGRDAGCNVSGMGTVAIIPLQQNLALVNIARIKTTKVEFDPLSNGYIVTFDLKWHDKTTTSLPITKTIIGKLNYIPRNTYVNGTTTYDVFGLQLKFQFNCRDFGIDSKSIGDKIDIECNMNFNNK